MSGIGRGDNTNVYIALALIAGIIAVLAVSFYYEIQLSAGSSSKATGNIPVVTVTATVVVIVPPANTTTCTNNETSSVNTTLPC